MLTLEYRRVSTDRQTESGLGLEVQAKRNAALAAMLSRGIDITYADEGVSASMPFVNRAKGGELMDFIEKFDERRDVVLIAYSLDRLFRDVDDGRAMLKWFDDHGVKVHLSNEGGNAIDVSSSMGRFLVTIRLAQGELERGLTGERTKAALGALKARGGRVGEPPYGWRKTEVRATFEQNPEEQQIIQHILEMAEEDVSAREIARRLNEVFEIKTRDGKLWSHQQIMRILGRAEGEGE